MPTLDSVAAETHLGTADPKGITLELVKAFVTEIESMPLVDILNKIFTFLLVQFGEDFLHLFKLNLFLDWLNPGFVKFGLHLHTDRVTKCLTFNPFLTAIASVMNHVRFPDPP